MAEQLFEVQQQLKSVDTTDPNIYLVSGINRVNQTYSIKGGKKGKEVVSFEAAHKQFKPADGNTGPNTNTGGAARL